MIFVFASILEFIIVTVYLRSGKKSLSDKVDFVLTNIWIKNNFENPFGWRILENPYSGRRSEQDCRSPHLLCFQPSVLANCTCQIFWRKIDLYIDCNIFQLSLRLKSVLSKSGVSVQRCPQLDLLVRFSFAALWVKVNGIWQEKCFLLSKTQYASFSPHPFNENWCKATSVFSASICSPTSLAFTGRASSTLCRIYYIFLSQCNDGNESFNHSHHDETALKISSKSACNVRNSGGGGAGVEGGEL